MSVATQVTQASEITEVKEEQLERIPPPPLPTLDEIRKEIPPECFKVDTMTSMRYLVQDYALLIGLYLILPYVEENFGIYGLLVWYWVFGFVGLALYVLGHDCGHGTFSDQEWVNDVCGHLAHAPLLGPYWPWQKSHRQHHQYTSHVTKDKGHPWVTEEYFKSRTLFEKYFASFPLSGWFRWHIYTMYGAPDGSHFWPGSRLFTTTEDRIKCVISAAACFFCAYIAFVIGDYSIYNWVKYYYIPLLFEGLFMIMVTYLQHSEPCIEVYENEEWSFMRGVTQTIDRSWGFGLDTIMHHITDGHVVHHLFYTRIPHYNLMKATEAIKKVYEPLKGTPYGYKSDISYDFFFKYLRYNITLDYLIHKSKGVLQYRIGVEADRAAAAKAAKAQ